MTLQNVVIPAHSTENSVFICESFDLIRAAELQKMLSVSASTLWRMRKRKEIPDPIVLSKRVIVWERQVILNWILESRNHVSVSCQ